MMRNIFIDEHLLLERVHEQQRDMERRLLLQDMPAPRQHLLTRLLSRLRVRYLLSARKGMPLACSIGVSPVSGTDPGRPACTTGVPAGQSSGD